MNLSSAGRSLQLLTRLLDTQTVRRPIIDTEPQKPAISTGRSTSLPRTTPEQQGISSRHIADFLQALQKEPTLRMHSVLILRNGEVLCRAAFGARDTQIPRMTFSACKSITALAVGILMDDGLIHPEDKLTDLFSDECGPVSGIRLRDLTIRHLLSMQTGNRFNEAACMTEAAWLKAYFGSPVSDVGRKFQYNSLNTYVLAALVTRLTGMSLSDFLTKRLFAPMGISDLYWERSPEGVEKGGWGLYLSPEDMAKLGQLVMDGGMWQGRQLISSEFIAAATHCHAQTPSEYGDFNYGWQIWVGRTENTFLFNGMFGQNVLGFRDSGIILVSNAGNDETFQTSAYFRLASQYFGGSFPTHLHKNLFEEWVLRRTVISLVSRPRKVPSAKDFQIFSGRRFITEDPQAATVGLLPLMLQTVENSYTAGLCAVSLIGTRQDPILLYEENDQEIPLHLGLKKPIRQQINWGGNIFWIAAQAQFTRNDEDHPVLRIQIDFTETPCTRILKLIATPQGMILQQQETPGAEFILHSLPAITQSAGTKALLSTVLGTAEHGYLRWRVERMFDQTLRLQEET